MTKIAFIDHHLNNYHADVFLQILRDGPIAEVVSAYETDPVGDDWCAKNGVPKASSIAEAVEKADGVIILAPDNIDQHLTLAMEVLPAGKPTVVDKFLALTVADAEAIVKLAGSTPLASASGLYFAEEFKGVLTGEPVDEAVVRGPAEWANYGIHTLSLAFRALGAGVVRVRDTGTAKMRNVVAEYADGRRANVQVADASNAMEHFNWQFAFRTGDSYRGGTVTEYHQFYVNLVRHSVKFFETCKSDITVGEMLDLVRVIEAAEKSLAADGAWVNLAG